MTRAGRIVLALVIVLVVLHPTGAAAQERTVTYTVSSQGSVQGDLEHFRAVARDALTDPRGWSLGGTLAFREVDSGSDFDLILASPAVVDAASPGCSAQWSCRVGRNVYINDDRWRSGTDSWPHRLRLYQRYVILHEVGHWLGVPHTDCPTPGRTAWVMQQQSISLQGCRANVWPVIAEREQVGRRMGVSVNWSAIERRYRGLGQEGGVLGVPITWEEVTVDRTGRYQHFAGGGGASIFWHPRTGAHPVIGQLRSRWAGTGWERGPLGYPVTGHLATADGVGRYTHFAGGGGASIYWHPRTGAHPVIGQIRSRWAGTGWERGPLGYPVTGHLATADGVGRYTDFSGSGGGSIYWHPRIGAKEVYGAIHDRWTAMDRESGPLGYPVSGVYGVEGGSRVDFQGGWIRVDDASGETEVQLDR